MFKIFMLIVFLVPTILNYKLTRKNIILVKKSAIEATWIILLFVLGSSFCYRFDKTIIGYLIVLAATMMLYTSVFFQGITEKGINIFLGGSPFLKWVEFNKIRKVEMEKNRKGNIELKVHVFGNVFKQVYSLEDEEKIVGLIKNRI